ncbi:MAG: DUF1697 domain-containing protein [Rhizobiaceae bacterium]
MPAVALLRAINVGGNTVKGPALVEVFTARGFPGATTLLASGNVIFDPGTATKADAEALIETAIATRLGLETAVLVRDLAAIDAMIAGNPFADAARDDPSHLVAIALKSAPAAGAEAAVHAAIRGREQVRIVADTLFAHYPDGIGVSKLTLPVIERATGVTGTGRNWTTIGKIRDRLLAAQGRR